MVEVWQRIVSTATGTEVHQRWKDLFGTPPFQLSSVRVVVAAGEPWQRQRVVATGEPYQRLETL